MVDAGYAAGIDLACMANMVVPTVASSYGEEPSRYDLEPSRYDLEPSWDDLEPSWDGLEPSWDGLEPSWDGFKPSWDGFKPSWDSLGEPVQGGEPTGFCVLGVVAAPTHCVIAPATRCLSVGCPLSHAIQCTVPDPSRIEDGASSVA